MKKYTICLILAFLLLSLPIFGAGNKEAAAGPPWKTVGTNEFGWQIPDKTLEINFYDATQQSPDYAKDTTAEIGAYILQKFNVKLNKLAYDMDPSEQQSLMLASNNYPEVIAGMTPDDAQKWVAQGRAMDVAPYLDTYGPTIKKKLAPLYKRLVDAKGRVLVMPQYWGMLPIPDQSAHIRGLVAGHGRAEVRDSGRVFRGDQEDAAAASDKRPGRKDVRNIRIRSFQGHLPRSRRLLGPERWVQGRRG